MRSFASLLLLVALFPPASVVSARTHKPAHARSSHSGRASRAAAPRVLGVRFWTAPDVTRLVLDLSQSTDFESEVSPDSMRVIVRVPGAALAPNLSQVAVRDSVVNRVVLRSVTGGGVRAEFQLARPTSVRVFALSPVPGRPHRIVMDAARVISPEQRVQQEKAVEAVAEARDRVVVIDPGHGGDAPGAEGPGRLWEKDVTLAIGRQLAEKLNAQPGLRAVLTRDGDYDLPLRRRFLLAEKYQADLFVSIHCNSSTDEEAHGTEVYFLSLNGATDEASKELAETENSADQLSGRLPEASDNVKSILFDLRQSDTLKKSSELAELVLQSLATRDDLVFRGVKQAGFAVLKSPLVPSILVETAFISNRKEARWLRDRGFQSELAGLVARGVAGFLDRYPNHRRAATRGAVPTAAGGSPAAPR